MVKPAGLLTAEERARITDIQDVLISLFVEHREAVENGENRRARTLQSESTICCAKRRKSRNGLLSVRPDLASARTNHCPHIEPGEIRTSPLCPEFSVSAALALSVAANLHPYNAPDCTPSATSVCNLNARGRPLAGIAFRLTSVQKSVMCPVSQGEMQGLIPLHQRSRKDLVQTKRGVFTSDFVRIR